MKLLTFCQNSEEKLGVLSECQNKIYSFEELGLDYGNMEEFIAKSTAEDLEKLRCASSLCRNVIDINSVQVIAPIPRPSQDVIIMEDNYFKDEKEASLFKSQQLSKEEPLLPIYYYKKATLANYDGGEIPSYPSHVGMLDYQVELAVIIKKDIKNVSEQDAAKYIFGYTIINNIIARDLVKKHRRPYIATSLDGFLPMGPWIVTADEFTDKKFFNISSSVNGEIRQNATTQLLKFSPEYAISDLSRAGVLRAGSIITTGTPFGSGCDFEPPKYLVPGDIVECKIEGIGVLRNVVV